MGIETVAIAATIASTLAATAGTVMQASASSRAAEYQAQVASNNAAIARNNAVTAENNAKSTEAAGASRADQEAMKTRELIGRQKIAAAASGLDVNSGSPADITAGTAGMGMWSGLNIRDDTNRRASALRQQGQNFEAQGANFDTSAAAAHTASDAAMTGGILSAAGTAFKGAAAGSGMLSEFQRTGVVDYDLATKLK